MVLMSLPHARSVVPAGEGGDLLKEPVVLVDEALVGGMLVPVRRGEASLIDLRGRRTHKISAGFALGDAL